MIHSRAESVASRVSQAKPHAPSEIAVRGLLVLVLLAAAASGFAAEPRDPLFRARVLYNQRQFEAAIAAADEGRRTPDLADSADLIAARAYLERYRESGSADDLTHARERLRRI